jgi:hypothetical protein
MKKIVIAFVFCISFCIFTNGQMKDADAVIKELFEILKTKDSARYVKLFPDYEGMKRLTAELFDSSSRKSEMDSFFLFFTEKIYKEGVIGKNSEKFDDFLKKGEGKEIIWNNIVLKGYTIDSSLDDDSEADFKTMDGKIDLLSGNREYTVKFKEAIWSVNDGRWYGAEFKSVFEKGKEREDDYTLSTADSITVSIDSIRMSEIDTTYISPPADYSPGRPPKTPVKKAPSKKPAAKSAAIKPKQ